MKAYVNKRRILVIILLFVAVCLRLLGRESVSAGGERELPDSFIMAVELCKEIKDGVPVPFESLGNAIPPEVSRNGKVYMAFEYKIPDSSDMPDGNPIAENIPYTFEIKGNFKDVIPFNIKLSEGGSAVTVATGVVSNNKVVLTFNEAAKNKGALDIGTEGEFWFEASFDKDKIENSGKQPFSVVAAGQTKEVEVNFFVDSIVTTIPLIKDGTLDLDQQEILWKITSVPQIDNVKTGDNNLKEWKIQDTIPEKLTYKENSVKVVASASGSAIDVSSLGTVNYEEDSRTLTYTFPNNTEINDIEYILTFVTTYDPTEEGFLTNGKAIFKNVAQTEVFYPQYKKDMDSSSPTYLQAIEGEIKTQTVTSKEKTIEIEGCSLDKKGALLNGAEMSWTVEVANSIKLEEPKIQDKLPEDTSLVADSIALDGTKLSLGTKDSAPSYAVSGSSIIVYLDKNKAEKQVLTYRTTFNLDWADKHKDGKVVNTAEFYGGPGPGAVLKATASVPLGGQLLTKNGTYNKSDHTIQWSIQVKNTGSNLIDIKFIDTIPNDQEYVQGSLKADGSASNAINGNQLEITYPDNYNSWNGTTPTITYQTRLTEAKKDELWGNNVSIGDKKQVENSITLEAKNLPSKSFTVKGTANVESTVLKKKFIDYDFTKKEVEWELSVNDNKMMLENPQVLDTVFEGWEFVKDSVKVKQGGNEVTLISPTFKKNGTESEMELTLPDMGKGDEPYSVTYRTKLVDDTILLTNKTIEAKNNATLKGNQICSTGVMVECKNNIAQAVLEKVGSNSNLGSGGYLTWNITVNRNLAVISAPNGKDSIAIQDILHKNLVPVIDSILINRLEIKPDGTEERKEELNLGKDYQVLYDMTTRKLLIEFKQSQLTKAYLVTMNTDVLESDTYSNSVSFVGMSSDMGATSKAVEARFSGGSTKVSYGTIEIEKQDEKGNPIDNAEFDIKKASTLKSVGTAQTDKSGKIKLSVRTGDYLITETKTPVGYEAPVDASMSVTVTKDKTSTVTFVSKKISSVIPPTPIPPTSPTPEPPTPESPTPEPPMPESPMPESPTPEPPTSESPNPNPANPDKPVEPTPSIVPTLTPKPSKPPIVPQEPEKSLTPDKTKTPIITNNENKKKNDPSKVSDQLNKKKTSNSEKNQKRIESEGVEKQWKKNRSANSSNVPQTGDQTNKKGTLIVCFFSFLILVFLLKIQWKRHKQK